MIYPVLLSLMLVEEAEALMVSMELQAVQEAAVLVVVTVRETVVRGLPALVVAAAVVVEVMLEEVVL